MRVFSLIPVAIMCAMAAAHPVEESRSVLVPRDCSAEVTAFNLARREKRGLSKRTFYSELQNLTCVAAPETPREDYVATPAIRQDVTEGQVGVPLTLDIGVIDVTTCQPLPNVMVEVWSPNAQGSYGATFLRGAYTSSSSGIAEFQTIFPGHTSDSANHINLMVHTSSSMSGSVSHAGQVFFTDRWTDVIGGGIYYGYKQNANSRMMNAQDPNYQLANSAGYNAIVDIEEIGDDWPDGVIGYITVGVNPSRKVTF
ncbi:Intradiol ring-cleavage dioxygenase [Crucibulum laeve]|uniref:Intradiol ring-cleavage dioxygenase n=1 Tax=Crucibulum laeve TaxID=68775 RepID=A0A5C3MAU7_9AGAR|nr:Intradiol ring-cleavage dioxygenase [Crucibulum laeve]